MGYELHIQSDGKYDRSEAARPGQNRHLQPRSLKPRFGRSGRFSGNCLPHGKGISFQVIDSFLADGADEQMLLHFRNRGLGEATQRVQLQLFVRLM